MEIKLREYSEKSRETIDYWNKVEPGTGEIMCDAIMQLEQHAKAGRNEATIQIRCCETFWDHDSSTRSISLNSRYENIKNHLKEKFDIVMYSESEYISNFSVSTMTFKWN